MLPASSLAQPPPPVSVDLGADDFSTDPGRAADQRARKAGVYDLRVRYVTIDARWAKGVKLPLAAGDPLTPQAISGALEALKQRIDDNQLHGYGLRTKGELGILHIAVEYDTSPSPADPPDGPRTVGVIFHPYSVRFSLERVGDNVLPIPRSPHPTFYDNVPAPLLALNPSFGVFSDRAFGTALGGSVNADLLNLLSPARVDPAGSTRRLEAHAQGLKAVDEPFYRAAAGLLYRQQLGGPVARELSLRASYDGVDEPLSQGEHTRTAALGGAGLLLKIAPNARLSLDTGFRWTDDRVDATAPELRTRTRAKEQLNRVLLDAVPPGIDGFGRVAVWEDNGWLDGGGTYQRLAARLGYSKEIAVRPGQTIGLEMLAGAGTSRGDVPAHARFFGGNSSTQFLYAGASSPGLLAMPSGPLIRSFGESQAGFRLPGGGVRGGQSFWHANLNVAIPLPWWSRPLIPNEETDIEDSQGRPVTIKQMMRRQVDVTGPSMLGATLKSQGVPAAEATKRAQDVFAEIRPATHFMIDDASIYAIKPLLMVDAGGLVSPGGSASETWLAAGAGIQVTVVTAKFEAGYVRTVSGPTFGDRGNVFVRLVFQNLF